jgi:arsenate reductase
MRSILFLCVENRARSQMAEGLARHFLGHHCDIFSAGSAPADRVHPIATAVMAEIGIDISKQSPKGLDAFDISKMDLVVTLCAEEQCPALPSSVKRLSWDLEDPAMKTDVETSTQIKTFRKIRDKLRQKILALRAADQVW